MASDEDIGFSSQHVEPWKGLNMPFHKFTEIEGPLERHVEQLWDEVKTLRKELDLLKRGVKLHKW